MPMIQESTFGSWYVDNRGRKLFSTLLPTFNDFFFKCKFPNRFHHESAQSEANKRVWVSKGNGNESEMLWNRSSQQVSRHLRRVTADNRGLMTAHNSLITHRFDSLEPHKPLSWQTHIVWKANWTNTVLCLCAVKWLSVKEAFWKT